MTVATPAEVETEIRAIMKARVEAVQAKNAARLVAHHAPDVVAYDLLEPLQYRGLTGVRERAQQSRHCVNLLAAAACSWHMPRWQVPHCAIAGWLQSRSEKNPRLL